MITNIFLLLVVFKFKHLIADFFLQGKYMLRKFSPGWDFFLPLLAHSAVHGAFTLSVCLLISPNLWWLTIVDTVAHFVMDRIKAGPKYLGRFKPLSGDQFIKAMSDAVRNEEQHAIAKKEAKLKLRHNVFYWRALGADQTFHALTDLFVVFILVTMGLG